MLAGEADLRAGLEFLLEGVAGEELATEWDFVTGVRFVGVPEGGAVAVMVKLAADWPVREDPLEVTGPTDIAEAIEMTREFGGANESAGRLR